MEIAGWGRYPRISARVTGFGAHDELAKMLEHASKPCIARGLGRSYGDSSLAADIIDVRRQDHFLAFDSEQGHLHCGAGATLTDILELVVPHGWFLPVTPGTGWVTVGGAIASDVHGKNHHIDGVFSDYVEYFNVMTADGSIHTCSRSDNADLFRAAAGGMGLCGVILDARLKLKRVVSSFVEERIIKTSDLEATLAGLEEYARSTYVVAWIDATKRGPSRGRALVIVGEHAAEGPLEIHRKTAFSVPLDMPSMTLNGALVRLFNALYYGRIRHDTSTRRVHYAPFFYPLDRIGAWNRLYGRPGLLQHQCVVPRGSGARALAELLDCVAASGEVAPLAVLKALGADNGNFLSFPQAGYTLTLDLKRHKASLELMRRLDDIVLAHGGRIYLAKDACMSESTFKRGYPAWEEFQEVRERFSAFGVFASRQSERLGL